MSAHEAASRIQGWLTAYGSCWRRDDVLSSFTGADEAELRVSDIKAVLEELERAKQQRVMLRGILNISHVHDGSEEFSIVPETGEPIEFAWLDEDESTKARWEVAWALRGLCQHLNIPYEQEER